MKIQLAQIPWGYREGLSILLMWTAKRNSSDILASLDNLPYGIILPEKVFLFGHCYWILHKKLSPQIAHGSISLGDYLHAMISQEVLLMTREWLTHIQAKHTTCNANWDIFQGNADCAKVLHTLRAGSCCNDHHTAAKTLPDSEFLDRT